jgi:3-oxoadipate enol-lactonase
VACPTLVLVGELDEPFIKASNRMASTISDARLAVIPGAGHSPQLEATDAWRAAIDEFLVLPEPDA